MEASHYGVVVPLGGAVACRHNTKTLTEMQKRTTEGRKEGRNIVLVTFNRVSEAFRGGGVVGRCVKSVHLQTVRHILGLWETLDHWPVDVSSRVPSDGRSLSAWSETGSG